MLLLPTRRRLHLLNQFVDSAISANSSCDALIIVDSKDYADNQKAYIELEQKKFSQFPGRWMLIVTKAETMGDKIREVWPIVRERKSVYLLNDDHYILTPEWDKKVEAILDGTNMVSTNDGFHEFGKRVVGVTAWSMPILEAAGFPIFPRNLKHLCIDDVWKAIGESSGCWHETMTINVEHRHFLWGKSERDETSNLVYSSDQWNYDLKEFQHFMEQDFKDVVARIRKLRESHERQAKFN